MTFKEYYNKFLLESNNKVEVFKISLLIEKEESINDKLKSKYGIEKFEKTNPSHSVYSIGFSPKQNKWYGWSHRAIFGFGVGSECKMGDCGFQPSNKEEFIEATKKFWNDDGNTFEITKDGIKVSSESGLSHIEKFPKKWGKGTWKAKTMEDAKQMAIDFAKSVS